METNTQQPTNGVAKANNIVDGTLKRISEMQQAGELKLPLDYSAANAMRAAWLILQDAKNMDKRPVLEVCTKESVSYALLNMVLQGLNPMKRQCSFIAYGNKLTLQREYQGSIAIAKRVGLKSVIANAIFEGDEFSYEVDGNTGRKKIEKHIQTIDSLGNAVKGAYAIITMDDGTMNVEVMNIKQIQQAWMQGPTKGQSPAHKNFPDQMACKTVIGRSLKTIINSSDDSALFEDDEPLQDTALANVTAKIEANANKTAIGFDNEAEQQQVEYVDTTTGEVIEIKTVQQQPEPEPVQEMKQQPINGTQIQAPF